MTLQSQCSGIIILSAIHLDGNPTKISLNFQENINLPGKMPLHQRKMKISKELGIFFIIFQNNAHEDEKNKWQKKKNNN